MATEAFVAIKLLSERLPGKNLMEFGGKPLCRHILDTLLTVRGVDEISVFCSDPRIVEFIPREVRFVQRDTSLDANHVRGRDLFQAFARARPAENYLLAHTTAPFTRRQTIEAALQAVSSGRHDSAFAGQRISSYGWYAGKPINYNPVDMARTQDIRPIIIENSSIYHYSYNLIMNEGRRIGDSPFIVEVELPEAIDIDTADDFAVAERFVDYLA